MRKSTDQMQAALRANRENMGDQNLDAQDEAARHATVISMINFAQQRGELELAEACAAAAVELGVLKHSTQRPAIFHPGLRAIPVFDPNDFWIASHLEKHFEEIRAETDHLETGQTSGFEADAENLVARGAWDQMVLFRNGQRVEDTCRLFPRTTEILEQVPKEILSCGFVKFSLLQPRSWIRPHCGPSNHPLRLHLAIRNTQDAQIRVADQLLQWTDGRCLIFDHSFEHEAWNHGDRPRLVLIVEIPHPDMQELEGKAHNVRTMALIRAVTECYFDLHNIRTARRNQAGELEIEHDGEFESYILKGMQRLGVSRIERLPDGQLQLFR